MKLTELKLPRYLPQGPYVAIVFIWDTLRREVYYAVHKTR